MSDARTTVDDRVWRALRAKLPGIGKLKVKVGVVGSDASASQPGGAVSMAELAAIHEYGAPKAGIPRRSFIRSTFVDKTDELKGLQKKVARALLSGKMSIEQAAGVLGAWGAGAIKAQITQRKVRPELSESAAGLRTIKRKGSSVTLLDTGALKNAITWARENS